MYQRDWWTLDSVVSVGRHSVRVLILKMVLDSGLLNVLTVYTQGNRRNEGEFGTDCSI